MDFKISDIPGEEDVRRSAEAHVIGKAKQDAKFRQELLTNPKQALAKELGVRLPDDFEVKVFEETPKSLYLVLPNSADDGELSDQLLESVSGGCSKGTATYQRETTSQSGYTVSDSSTGEMDPAK